MPTFTLVTGEEANAEFGGERLAAPVHRGLATALLEGLVERGFDMAYSQHAELGHAFATPFRFVLGGRPVPVVPLLVNVHLPPLPSGRRCEALGRAVGEIVAERPEKVAVLASGGMSHYPGTPRYPHPEYAVDEWVLERVAANDLDPVLDLTPTQLDEVGEGELLTWFVLWGAGRRSRTGRRPGHREVRGGGLAVSRTPPFAFTNTGYQHYRYPAAESYAFNTLLRDFRDPALRRRYLDDPDGVVAAYGLTAAESTALQTLDVDTCVAAGAHPLLAWTGCRMTARDREAAGGS